jgi:hypothetical protein
MGFGLKELHPLRNTLMSGCRIALCMFPLGFDGHDHFTPSEHQWSWLPYSSLKPLNALGVEGS